MAMRGGAGGREWGGGGLAWGGWAIAPATGPLMGATLAEWGPICTGPR
jgi:hypothetical protein